jgi:hypothetical protein
MKEGGGIEGRKWQERNVGIGRSDKTITSGGKKARQAGKSFGFVL